MLPNYNNRIITWNYDRLLSIYPFESFSHQRYLIVSYRSLSDTKSHQVSRTLLSILANLNNAVVWMVTTRLLISNSSIPFINTLATGLSAPFTIGTTVTFMFHSCCFFSSLTRSYYLSFFSPSFSFILWSVWTSKVHCFEGSLFLSFFSFFFFYNYEVRSCSWDYVMCLYLKISENFVCLIF